MTPGALGHASSVFARRDHLAGEAGRVEVGFTAPGLDLGDRAEESVRRAGLAALARETGVETVLMRQVHGAVVADVATERGGEPATADALVTLLPRVALATRAADCVPLLLADPDVGVLAAVHAGRGGLAHEVVPRAVARMRAHGARRVTAWLGPHICGRCYEVPPALQDEVAAVVPEARATTSWGTPSLDLGAGVTAQLGAAGCTDVRGWPECTREVPRWPSHRRDGARAGRFAGVVWRA